jgi:hypothetical protein
MNDFDKDNKIKELEEILEMERMVRKSEVLINQELKEQIEKKDLHIKTLLEVNDKFYDKIIDLKIKFKKFTD